MSFATHVSVQMVDPNGTETERDDATTSKSGRPVGQHAVPTVVTQLAIGCRKKVVVYGWKDGEPQEVKVWPSR